MTKLQTKRITIPLELYEKLLRLNDDYPSHTLGWRLLSLVERIDSEEYLTIVSGEIFTRKHATDENGNVYPINNWLTFEQFQTLIKGLSDIANNFGGGSFSGSPDYQTECKFRAAASKALKDAGLKYYEVNEEPGDGWYIKGNKIAD